jgi:hypothetical protein
MRTKNPNEQWFGQFGCDREDARKFRSFGVLYGIPTDELFRFMIARFVDDPPIKEMEKLGKKTVDAARRNR